MSDKKQTTAAVPKPETSSPIDLKYLVRISGILFAICVVTVLLLGIVNRTTAPRIEVIKKEKAGAAMSRVLPADEYIPWAEELPRDESITFEEKAGKSE